MMPAGFVLGAVPRRADARDGLVGSTLAGLPAGGLVATGSARRRAQLAALRPDLVFTDLRGNMARRVAVAEEGRVSAVVVAVAALERLGWESRLSDVLDPVDVLPQAGQGAIAVQCRADDDETRRLLAAVDHGPSQRALRAERAVLAGLGGSCTVPVGAYAEPDGDGAALRVSGLVASGDGHTVIRLARHGEDPEIVGAEVARALLSGGGAAIEGFGGRRTSCRDRLPRRRRPRRPRAPHPSGGGAPGPGRCGPPRPPGQPGRPRPGPTSALLIDVGKDPDAGGGSRAPGGDRTPAGRARPGVRRRGAPQGGRPVPLRPGRRGGRGAGAGRDPLGGGPGGDVGLRRPRRRRHPGHAAGPGRLGDGGDGPGRRAARHRRARTGRRWPA